VKETLPVTGLQPHLLEALRRRVATNPTGQVLLPVGWVEAAELKRVLEALGKASSHDPVS
jgi:hypothetical protein